MKDSPDSKVIHTHLDPTFQTTTRILEQRTDGINLYYVEIYCLHSDSEVTIPCPTKRSAEILCHWFTRGLAHA